MANLLLNSCIETPAPTVMFYGDGAIGRWLRLDKVMWVQPHDFLIRRGLLHACTLPVSLSPCRRKEEVTWAHSKKGGHLHPQGGAVTRKGPCWHPDLRIPASRTVRKKPLEFKQFILFLFRQPRQTRKGTVPAPRWQVGDVIIFVLHWMRCPSMCLTYGSLKALLTGKGLESLQDLSPSLRGSHNTTVSVVVAISFHTN